jgi:hypothetical protein
MIQKLKAGARLALGLHKPGRNLQVWPDDTFLVSYPKSGNTWTRFLVANLVYPGTTVDFSNIPILVPDPEGLSKRQLARLPRPRILKSHQYFDPRYKRVIYVVRDPRDVAVSQYHFRRKRRVIADDYPMDKFVADFIVGDGFPYGSWGENVGSWLATRQNRPDFLLLRYEDILEDATRELAKVAAFLNVPADPERLRNAVNRSTADEMRKMEKAQSMGWSTTKETRQDIPFVRAAKAGGWRDSLSDESVAHLEAAWGRLMSCLGYELRFPERANSDAGEFLLTGPVR